MFVSPDIAREALAGIIQSPRFKQSPRLSRLLTFLVEETLEGRGGALKGYTIGLEVFDKRDDFDPSQDPIVRVQMGRLRQAIESYDHNEGQGSPVRLRLTKGSYAVHFETAPSMAPLTVEDAAVEIPPPPTMPPNSAVESTPILQSIPFAALFARPLNIWATCALLVMSIALATYALPPKQGKQEILSVVTAMTPIAPSTSWRPKMRVFAPPVGKKSAHFKTAMLGGLSHYLIIDTIAVDQEVAGPLEMDRSAVFTLSIVETADERDLALRLTDEVEKKIIWATTASALELDIGTHDGRRQASTKLVKLLLQQRGLLFSYLATRSNLDSRLACVVKSGFLVSHRDARPEMVSSAKACLEQLIQNDRAPAARALYAHLHVAPFDTKSSPETALKLALDAATESPRNSLVQRSLMVAYWHSGQIELALKTGAIAVATNPLNSDVAAAYGFRTIAAGHYQKGLDILSAAMHDLLPGDACWDLGLFLGHLGLGDDAVAATIGARLARTDNADLAVARIVSLKLLGRLGEASEDLQLFAKRFPQFAKAPHTALATIGINKALSERIRAIVVSIR